MSGTSLSPIPYKSRERRPSGYPLSPLAGESLGKRRLAAHAQQIETPSNTRATWLVSQLTSLSLPQYSSSSSAKSTLIASSVDSAAAPAMVVERVDAHEDDKGALALRGACARIETVPKIDAGAAVKLTHTLAGGALAHSSPAVRSGPAGE